jgi:hypothetical protein
VAAVCLARRAQKPIRGLTSGSEAQLDGRPPPPQSKSSKGHASQNGQQQWSQEVDPQGRAARKHCSARVPEFMYPSGRSYECAGRGHNHEFLCLHAYSTASAGSVSGHIERSRSAAGRSSLQGVRVRNPDSSAGALARDLAGPRGRGSVSQAETEPDKERCSAESSERSSLATTPEPRRDRLGSLPTPHPRFPPPSIPKIGDLPAAGQTHGRNLSLCLIGGAGDQRRRGCPADVTICFAGLSEGSRPARVTPVRT